MCNPLPNATQNIEQHTLTSIAISKVSSEVTKFHLSFDAKMNSSDRSCRRNHYKMLTVLSIERDNASSSPKITFLDDLNFDNDARGCIWCGSDIFAFSKFLAEMLPKRPRRAIRGVFIFRFCFELIVGRVFGPLWVPFGLLSASFRFGSVFFLEQSWQKIFGVFLLFRAFANLPSCRLANKL